MNHPAVGLLVEDQVAVQRGAGQRSAVGQESSKSHGLRCLLGRSSVAACQRSMGQQAEGRTTVQQLWGEGGAKASCQREEELPGLWALQLVGKTSCQVAAQWVAQPANLLVAEPVGLLSLQWEVLLALPVPPVVLLVVAEPVLLVVAEPVLAAVAEPVVAPLVAEPESVLVLLAELWASREAS